MKLDLHVHSRRSYDSLATPRAILRTAKKVGLEGLAITDHNTIAGALDVSKENSDKEFLVIVGAEIKTDMGDMIGLFLTDEIKSRRSIEVVEEIERQGGLAVLPHPFRGQRFDDELVSKVGLIEAYNSRESEASNSRALELARKWDKPFVGGSDAHFLSEIGLCKVIVGSGDLRKELVSKNTKMEFRRSQIHAHFLSFVVGSVRARRFRRIVTEPGWYAAESIRRKGSS